MHDKIGVEKLKSFLEKATDNEQYCIIFAHDFKQINDSYDLGKLKELLNNHFKQRLAFICNNENLSVLKSEQKLHELNACLINASKDSHTDSSLSAYRVKKGGVKKRGGLKRLKEFNLFEALLNLLRDGLRDGTSDFFS